MKVPVTIGAPRALAFAQPECPLNAKLTVLVTDQYFGLQPGILVLTGEHGRAVARWEQSTRHWRSPAVSRIRSLQSHSQPSPQPRRREAHYLVSSDSLESLTTSLGFSDAVAALSTLASSFVSKSAQNHPVHILRFSLPSEASDVQRIRAAPERNVAYRVDKENKHGDTQ